MARRKRTKSEIDYDRMRIAEMVLKGMYQEDICKAINEGRPSEKHITRQQISVDIEAIRMQWRASAAGDIAAIKAEELAKLNVVEREAWIGWERSKRDAVSTTAEKQGDGDIAALSSEKSSGEKPAGKIISKTRLRRDAQTGDPRFLTTIQHTMDRRARLLGLDAPIKTAETDVAGNDVPRAVTMQDVVQMVRSQMPAQPWLVQQQAGQAIQNGREKRTDLNEHATQEGSDDSAK